MSELRVINDIGIALRGDERDRIQDIRIYPENGSIQMWVEMDDPIEAFQYLTPAQAMSISVALKRMAIEVFEAQASIIS